MLRLMSAETLEVRIGRRSDAPTIAAIYAPIVRDTVISFEIEPPSAEAMADRIDATLPRYPWLVATVADQVVGYAYASEHQQRAAYRWSANVTAYVAESARRAGVGRRLYRALIAILAAQGFRTAFAGITLPNDASVGLHVAIGFEPLGVYKEVGFKLGAWRDVGWWRLKLSDLEGTPAEPMSFVDLKATTGFRALLV